MNTSDIFAIQTSELTRQFGNLTVVDHIDLRVSYGEVFGLLGANQPAHLSDRRAALRGLMITGGESVHGYTVDFAVMLAVFAILLFVAVKLYPTLAE